jgi:dihydrofolate reductase
MIFEKILGIGACDEAGNMGKDGKLPWFCPEDLKHFSDTTNGSPIIMGSHTLQSLPSHYLKERTAIIFTHYPLRLNRSSNLIFVSSLSEFFALEGRFSHLYVIGGAQIFSLFLRENLIQEFILTQIKGLYAGDTVFPLSLLRRWPNLQVQETSTFSIHRYCNPL